MASLALDLRAKLQQCGKLLDNWAEKEVGNTKIKIQNLLKEIDLIQSNEDITNDDFLVLEKQRELEKLLL